MKAAVYQKYGPPEVLLIQELERPVPKDNELLIKIFATSVTSGDCRMRRADPFAVRFFNGLTKPKKIQILGNEFSGEIEEVGKNVRHFEPGDKVFGQTGMSLGANAEYICLSENATIEIKPDNLTWEEAATIPFGANTALHFLREGNIKGGQKVLIYGGSGSIGTAAIQLARYFGAEVTAVCSGENVELVRSMGANKIIDYTKEDFTKNGETYNIIFDTTGKSNFAACVKSLKLTGIYLRAVHMTLPPIIRGIWTNVTTNKKVIGGIAVEKKENLSFLKELIDAGRLKPVIDKRFSLQHIREAHAYVDKGHKKGNVAIIVRGKKTDK